MTDRPVRVIIVEDHAMVLEAVAAALGQRDDIEIAGTATSLLEAVDLLALTTADVVVADLQLGDGRGTELVAHANRLNPPPAVLLMTGNDPRKAIKEALAVGCAGFISKTQPVDRLVEAVLAVAGGAAVFPATLFSEALVRHSGPTTDLSARELEVLQLLGEARGVTDIAKTLYLSPHTVRNHIKQILRKLEVHSKLQAVVAGAREGLIDIT